jgi:hypothetical protein
MAIKGKNRAKNKPKQVSRAPRREPVVVKPPLFQRRWIQLVAAFVVGLFAMTMVIWVTNGLRQNKADAAAAAAASKRRIAATAWQAQVESQMGKIGTPGQQGGPPTVFDALSQALDGLKSGKVPSDAAATFKSASADAKGVVDSLNQFDLSGTISDQGLSPSEATSFADSKDRLATTLQLYQRAAEVGAEAVDATGAQRKTLAAIAIDLRDSAQAELQQAWINYTAALVSGGIYVSAPSQVPGP